MAIMNPSLLITGENSLSRPALPIPRSVYRRTVERWRVDAMRTSKVSPGESLRPSALFSFNINTFSVWYAIIVLKLRCTYTYSWNE